MLYNAYSIQCTGSQEATFAFIQQEAEWIHTVFRTCSLDLACREILPINNALHSTCDEQRSCSACYELQFNKASFADQLLSEYTKSWAKDKMAFQLLDTCPSLPPSFQATPLSDLLPEHHPLTSHLISHVCLPHASNGARWGDRMVKYNPILSLLSIT